MLKINFTNEMPEQKIVHGIAISKEGRGVSLPSALAEAMKRKPHDPVVEVLTTDERFIVVRINDDTAKGREEAGALLYKKAAEGIDTTLLLDCRELGEKGLDLLVGILLAGWRFDKYRTAMKPEETPTLDNIVVLAAEPEKLRLAFAQMQPAVEGVLLARALTSEPPNVLFPTAYAERLKELQEDGVEVEILDEAMLHTIGMTAILAVGQGSARASSVVVMQWNGAPAAEPPIVVVGKGVCFDSGGLCLKSTAHQHEMKWDKAGAGVVAGFLKSLALAKTPVNVVGIVGLVENMPDGAAVKPGDILRTMSGQTVEIVNTDAEGRLVLADCLWYAQSRFQPAVLIDLGTLTMETFASLGNAYAGLYANDASLAESLKQAGERVGDLLWELPMGTFFAKQIESPVADMKNVGIDFLGENGAAAEFLKRFVRDVPWAHIDIAGVAWSKEDLPLSQKGVTGFGVRLLMEWVNRRG